MAWATDNKTIFYVTEDAVSKRNNKFFRRVLGSDKYDCFMKKKTNCSTSAPRDPEIKP